MSTVGFILFILLKIIAGIFDTVAHILMWIVIIIFSNLWISILLLFAFSICILCLYAFDWLKERKNRYPNFTIKP